MLSRDVDRDHITPITAEHLALRRRVTKWRPHRLMKTSSMQLRRRDSRKETTS